MLPNFTIKRNPLLSSFQNYLIEKKNNDKIIEDIYNYCSIDKIKTLTPEEQKLLKDYYQRVHFHKGDITDSLEDFSSHNLFNYEKWNILSSETYKIENKIKYNFRDDYNAFIKSDFNTYFVETETAYNNLVDKINYLYDNNLTSEGTRAFKLLTKEKFADPLQKKIDLFIKDKTSQYERVSIGEGSLAKKRKQHLVLLERGES